MTYGRTSNASVPPLVFLYDRSATAHRAILTLRLDDCRAYAERQGWDVAGVWIDQGTDALLDGHRPKFTAMIREMETASREREVVCLIQTWERLTRDKQHRKTMRDRVAHARGVTRTADGESDVDDDAASAVLPRTMEDLVL